MKSSKHKEEDETERSTKRTKKSNSSANTKKTKPKKTKKTKSETEGRSKETNELSLSVKNTKNIEKCLSYLESYFSNLNTSNLENIITEKNLNNFQKLNEIENIEVDLLLTKIYNKIFSSDYLYTTFFSDQEENEGKIDITLALIDEVLQNIENFDDAVISLENFQLKGNVLKLIKFMKINLKESLDNDDIKQLDSYVNDLPNKFYSKNYIEIMKYKSKLYKNNYELLKNIEKIDEIFSNLESYYEQLSAIENLFTDIELNNEEDKKNYISVSKKDIKKKKKKKKSKRRDDSDEEDDDEDEDDEDDITSTKEEKEKITEEDLINYGQFLVNICVYQKFNFQSEEQKLDKKNSQKNKQKSKQKQTKKKGKKKQSKEEEDEEEGEEEEDDEEKEENNEEEEEEEDEDSEDDPQNCLNIFLKDVAQKTTGKKKKGKGDMKLRDLLKNKICLSSMERKNLFEIIKKNALNFNNLIKDKKSREIKEIKEKLDLYITSIQEDKNITIDPSKINHVKYYNNFSNNKSIIPNRDSKVFYIQNAENQKGLLLIEFFVTDEKKDIIFTLSRYDLDSDDFNEIYTTGKINKKCKICVYFDEKSLYQLEFNNEYSWINSKEINYNISMFKLCDENNVQKENGITENNVNINNNTNNKEKLDAEEENNDIPKKNIDEKKKKKEKKKEKENENEIKAEEEEINTKEVKISPALLNNEKQIKFICSNDNINYEFNCNKIYKKIKDYQETQKNNPPQKTSLEMSLLIYQNKVRFVNIDENNKIKYVEYCDEKDNVISKKFFNKIVYNYLKENNKPANENDNTNNKVLINLYCQNKNLSLISERIKELISALQDYSINNDDKFQNKIYIQFLEKLGFYPDKKISNYDVKYNLYDFTDQCLIYHLFLNHIQERHLDNSALVMIFDKDTIHITSMNQNVIFNQFKTWEKNLKVKYYSQIKYDEIKTIFNFIKALAESFEGFDLVLCSMNNEEKKEEMENKFKQIKQFTDEKVEEGIRLFVYDEDKFIVDMLKYIEMFSDE